MFLQVNKEYRDFPAGIGPLDWNRQFHGTFLGKKTRTSGVVSALPHDHVRPIRRQHWMVVGFIKIVVCKVLRGHREAGTDARAKAAEK